MWWFLPLVFFVLFASVLVLGWISQRFVFGKLEPPFIGALVAAAGTIFAGCIAYTAANENVAIAAKGRDDAIEQRNKLEAQVAKAADDTLQRELRTVRELKQFVDDYIACFKDATNREDSDFFRYMIDSENAGNFPNFIGSPPPESLRFRFATAHQRFLSVRGSAMRLMDARTRGGMPDDEFNGRRAELNLAIRGRVEDLKVLSKYLAEETEARSKK
jgi:hypothetical protein